MSASALCLRSRHLSLDTDFVFLAFITHCVFISLIYFYGHLDIVAGSAQRTFISSRPVADRKRFGNATGISELMFDYVDENDEFFRFVNMINMCCVRRWLTAEIQIEARAWDSVWADSFTSTTMATTGQILWNSRRHECKFYRNETLRATGTRGTPIRIQWVEHNILIS